MPAPPRPQLPNHRCSRIQTSRRHLSSNGSLDSNCSGGQCKSHCRSGAALEGVMREGGEVSPCMDRWLQTCLVYRSTRRTPPPPLPFPPTHPQANTLQLKTAWLIDNRSSSYHITTARNFVVNFWGIILRTSPNPRGVTPDRRMRTIQQDLPSSVRPSIMATSSPIISGEQSVVGASSGDTSRRMEARHASGGGTSHVYQ